MALLFTSRNVEAVHFQPIGQHTAINVFESGYSTIKNETGYELAILEDIVAAHDWSIFFTESVDGGARFEIWTR